MKTFKGTKGEWKMTTAKFDHFRIGSDEVPKVNGKQLRIATVFCEKAWQDKYVVNMGRKQSEVRISIEEGKANAKLMRASKELLEALQKLVHSDDDICKCIVCKIGKKAINKAL